MCFLPYPISLSKAKRVDEASEINLRPRVGDES